MWSISAKQLLLQNKPQAYILSGGHEGTHLHDFLTRLQHASLYFCRWPSCISASFTSKTTPVRLLCIVSFIYNAPFLPGRGRKRAIGWFPWRRLESGGWHVSGCACMQAAHVRDAGLHTQIFHPPPPPNTQAARPRHMRLSVTWSYSWPPLGGDHSRGEDRQACTFTQTHTRNILKWCVWYNTHKMLLKWSCFAF